MQDKGKAALAVGGLAGLAGVIYLATKGKAAPPEGPSASVSIEVLDSEGNPVPRNSPAVVNEGESYTVMVAVTNTTTKGGVPFEADLETWVMAAAGWIDLIPGDIYPSHYLPGSIGYFYSTLNIPMGLGGMTGAITVNVFDPGGKLIATKVEPLTIKAMALIYGASISISV